MNRHGGTLVRNGIRIPDGVFDLFAGAGGLSWGWHAAGYRPLVAIDLDPAAARTYELNFSSAHTVILNRDLGDTAPEELVRDLGGERPDGLFVISGGPPCQGWSKVGRGKLRSLQDRATSLLYDPRNHLYRRFVEYVAFFRPPVFMMENVPGMLNLEGRNVADEVLSNFQDAGYSSSYAIANARWFGVPQDRRRLIFIGVREDLATTVETSELKDFAPYFRSDLAGLPGETNLRQAIADLPEVPHGIREDPQPYRRKPGRRSRFAELMRAHSNGVITDHVCREHNDQDLEAFAFLREGGQYHELPARLKRYRDDIFKDKYKKLYWDRPAWTVTAHFAKDVYTHIHPSQTRTISIREAARLQSFPDDFRFFGNMGDRFRQIGNAVPPLMAWGIAEFIAERVGSRA
jgi:DNA (cytosine-5)-methyltransferase 1